MRRARIIWVATWAGVIVIAAVVGYLQETDSERWLVFGATTMLITAALHSILGERFILTPLFRRQDLPRLFGDPEFVPRTLRFVWHLTSIAFVGLAAVLIAIAADASTTTTLLRIVSLTAASSAVLAAIISRGRHLSWVAFASVALASWLAIP